MEDDDLESNNVKSSVSYFNISSRAPLHSNNEFDNTLWDDILPHEDVEIKERKRKYEDLQEQKPNKALKLWNIMKYPFQKITIGTSVIQNEGNISKAEVVNEIEEPTMSNTTVCENDDNNFVAKESNEPINFEPEIDVEDTSDNVKKDFKICNIM